MNSDYKEIEKAQIESISGSMYMLRRLAMTGGLDGFVYSDFTDIRYEAGPRVGTLYMRVNPRQAPRFVNSISANDCLRLRSVFHNFQEGTLEVGTVGHWIYATAAWKPGLQQGDLYALDFATCPHTNGHWPAGITGMQGKVVNLQLSDYCPHRGIFGMTGSGKTEAALQALSWLGQNVPKCALDGLSPNGDDQGNWLILIDPKLGKNSFRTAADFAGLVGPMATEIADIEAALTWAVSEMTRRNALHTNDIDRLPRLIIFMDEVQRATEASPLIATLLRRLATEGRTANIYLVVLGHSPRQSEFGGESTKSDIPGRQVFKVASGQDSHNALGTWKPNAATLTRFECLVLDPAGSDLFVRMAAFKCDSRVMDRVPRGLPQMTEWPALDANDYLDGGRITIQPSPLEAACAIAAAEHGYGRDNLQRMLEGTGVPIRSNGTADTLKKWGQAVLNELVGNPKLRKEQT